MAQQDFETFKLGDWELQSGEKLINASIAYKTFGDPKSPAIVYPTWFSGYKTLNPKTYFIVIPALFGNGQSTSPSNYSASDVFPACSFYDNVRAQYTLVTQHLGITHLHAVVGWSMGAAQSYQWATQYPDFMDLVVPFCGSARTSLHNQVFLEGVKGALLAAKHTPSAVLRDTRSPEAGQESRIWNNKEKQIGLKALGRVYAGWGFSQAFYREKLAWRTSCKVSGRSGLSPKVSRFKPLSVFTLLVNVADLDPENLLAHLQTWQQGDVSNQEPYNGDFEKAMASIKAKTLVLPGKTDLYFP
ncbi:unnamed protein product [Aspergillus oryzae RIB40]|uniref:DNA, SC005 n=1 Tax=Aspergillus oryzae (strain ATCC 42149 / RIB 40) TaxID=510516 RepID=Q2UQM7_ASPOR|nr:unnamed protein product [Aspergillus oryzae RIB40]BAE56138.1 unnamed protein product [Aspergillus oryzae RIB40]